MALARGMQSQISISGFGKYILIFLETGAIS
jgi:hypothetical protein